MNSPKTRLDSELDKIEAILNENSYQEDVISNFFRNKIASFSADKKYGPEKCPVYLKMPWLGLPLLRNVSLRFEDQIKEAITKCFATANPRFIFSIRKVLSSVQKDCVPSTLKSLVFLFGFRPSHSFAPIK